MGDFDDVAIMKDAIAAMNLKGLDGVRATLCANLVNNQVAHKKRLNEMVDKAMMAMVSPDPMAEIRKRVENFQLR